MDLARDWCFLNGLLEGYYMISHTVSVRDTKGTLWVLSCLSCVQHFATLRTVARQAPLFMIFSRQEALEWVAMPSSKRSFWPRDWTLICITGRFFTAEPLGLPLTNYIYELKDLWQRLLYGFPKLFSFFSIICKHTTCPTTLFQPSVAVWLCSGQWREVVICATHWQGS